MGCRDNEENQKIIDFEAYVCHTCYEIIDGVRVMTDTPHRFSGDDSSAEECDDSEKISYSKSPYERPLPTNFKPL